MNSSASHIAAETRYNQARTQARQLAEQEIPARYHGMVKIRSIDQDALSHAAVWRVKRKAQGTGVAWSFPDGFSSYRFRHPNRLDIAVWADATLCSLAIGVPTKTASSMRLDVIEASPDLTPISGEVFPITLAAFQAYALLIGAGSITVMRPLNEKLIGYYESRGFVYLKSKGSAPARMWKAL